ncbi:UDP-N-acetylglucosamine--N-acetylmuramyl-(pentapeptide) pyrophosphoryl-undecaprenol N-acetylglucosamine transferase [bacterium HR15]|nr:UDP-N-acetylglucosamine--N-acetylmuramyl-(pentapeptide) pyrophosphoryl-undecaprenol N-acetylglucosamine transferase [bacterium HR15]
MKVAIAGGITGGHLFPALCVGDALQQAGAQLLYLGARHGLEARMPIPFPALLLEMSGLRSTMRRPWRMSLTLWQATREARRALQQFNAELLFCTGGYSSLPAALAMRALHKPIVLLEPDAFPGRANRWLARFAQCVCLNFEEAAKHFPRGSKILRTGLPVRAGVCRPEVRPEEARAHFGLLPDRFTVLVIGGSQGAQSLNEIILNTVQYIPSGEIQWLHITGEAHYETVRATADRLALNGNYRPLPFLEAERMGLAYRTADIAIARGGAGTITELALNALPAILVPYPYAAGGHQRYNCQTMVQRGAALMIEQHELSPERIAQAILTLRDCPSRRMEMSQRAFGWAVPNATERVLKVILSLLSNEIGNHTGC